MYELRPAQPSDVTFLSTLEREVMESHARALWGAFRPGEHISDFDLRNTRIVEVDGQGIGYVQTEQTSDHLRLRKLYLRTDHQGMGLGRRLLQQVQREADGLGLPLRLSVLRPNTRALAFYQREGLQVAEMTEERIFLQSPAVPPAPNPTL